ncbi:MAG: hypothetical protein QOH21_1103 [Acidobacteriota bacterium]|jgi:hypothetical protein|nr:hypothetical protein [Acidobacteriota bacterium]
MKRAVLIVAVAALCVAGSAMAQDRSGGLIGSGTRAEDSGQVMGSGGFTMTTPDQYMGSGGRTADDGQSFDSGGLIGSGTRAGNSGQIFGSGTRAEASGQIFGSGSRVTSRDGGYLGSGLSVLELRLFDGSSLLVVSSDEGMFVIRIEEYAHYDSL